MSPQRHHCSLWGQLLGKQLALVCCLSVNLHGANWSAKRSIIKFLGVRNRLANELNQVTAAHLAGVQFQAACRGDWLV